jgi:hypothetical protein
MESAQSGVGSMPIQGMLQCSTAGTLSFSWTQNSSNVTASIVGKGSWLRATRVLQTSGTFSPSTVTVNTASSGYVSVPAGASSMEIEAWGGSAGGGGSNGVGGFGGGSGGYCKSIYSVAAFAGQTIAYAVGAAGIAGGPGGATTVISGTFAITSMSAGGGIVGGGGAASGGNTTNTAGNAGTNGNPGAGGAGIAGDFGTGSVGGISGSTAPSAPLPGGAGLLKVHFT